MAGTAREEAERLVATVLAMAEQSGLGPKSKSKSNDDGTANRVTEGLGALGETLAGVVGQLTGASSGSRGGSGGSGTAGSNTEGSNTGGHRGGAWATGSPECCVCPLCKLIAGMREPGPQTAERLATGAGDLAMGVASMMRAVSAITSNPRPKPARPARPAPPTPDQAWSTATHMPEPTARHEATATESAARHEATATEPAGRQGAPATEPAGHQEAADAETRATEGTAAESPAHAAAEPGRPAARPPVTPPVGVDPWSAASSADAASTAADQRARAARRTAEAETARLAARAEATRLAARAAAAREAARQAAQAEAAEAQAALQTAAAQSAEDGTAGETGSGGHEPSVGTGGPRNEKGFAGLKGERPATGDVWAAATGETGVAPQRNVDHDVAGPAADAGRAGSGSEAAGDA
jgi:hypothetical protein